MLSVLSVSKRLSTDCKRPVHRAFVSLTVLNTFFATFRYKFMAEEQMRSLKYCQCWLQLSRTQKSSNYFGISLNFSYL